MPPSAASPAGRLEARAQHRGDDERGGDRQQEPRALEEGEVGAVEVDAEVVGGERADEQRREERADAGGGGHPHPLQDVEDGASRSDSLKRA